MEFFTYQEYLSHYMLMCKNNHNLQVQEGSRITLREKAKQTIIGLYKPHPILTLIKCIRK